MESTDIGGAIAEKADSSLVGSSHFGGKTDPGGNWYSRPHNPHGTQYANIHISNVHRASLTLIIAGFLGKQLSHHPVGFTTLGNQMPMSAVGA